MYRKHRHCRKGTRRTLSRFIQNIETASAFAKEGEVVWQSATVVSIYTVREAPQVCLACCIRRLYFKVRSQTIDDNFREK